MPRIGRAGTYLGLGLLSVIWGMAFIAIKVADTELTPVNLALIRWLLASVPFLLLLPVIGKPKAAFEKKDAPRLLVVALANVAGYHITLNYAETTLTPGVSALLIAFGPIFIVVLSYFLLNEKAGRRIVAGLALAIVGTAVLSLGSMTTGGVNSVTGVVEALGTALCYALFAVVGKPLVVKYGSAPTTILAGLVGTAMLLPLVSTSLVMQLQSLDFYGWASVLYLGLLSTVFGYLMFYSLISSGTVARVSIQLYLIPLVSVIGGTALLGDSLTLAVLLGGGLMLGAVALATWK